MANAPLTQTTGRRKEAVARAVLRSGTGKITVNGKPIEAYFTTATQRMVVTEALRVIEREQSFDINANIFGGGVNAFSRYEKGKTKPPLALVKLFKLLDRHPNLLDEIRTS